MASVNDVAAYILEKHGRLSAMKLQKLVYYCQAWSLVWDDRPLFEERIEAWANGPVVPFLYEQHKGCYDLAELKSGNPKSLDEKACETIDAVLNYYGDQSAQWLSDLTHAERPWKEARAGLADGERGNNEISLAVMSEYYSSLDENGNEP